MLRRTRLLATWLLLTISGSLLLVVLLLTRKLAEIEDEPKRRK